MRAAGAGDDEGASSVAVIGMACRLPGARSPAELWANLRAGVESVHAFSDEELLGLGESLDVLRDPRYVKARAVLEGADEYDAAFFGHDEREAARLDPQLRVFLETSWEAFESAGYVGSAYPGSVGVFAASGASLHPVHHQLGASFFATRVSYELDLRGPSLNVQTACSSALVAVHVAAQSLLAGECDLALAGASALWLPQDRGYFYEEGDVLSPDGHCRAFDARAQGTSPGSGAGCVVLKRLDEALADGDTVLAILRGSAVNNDGGAKISYLAPSVEGQARAIVEALAVAGVSPETISYVEAHGSGTRIGDAIEVAALTRAYRASTDRNGYCAIGSIKPNIGHLGEAGGIAAFIKAVLALTHRELPPSLHCETPSPDIDFPRTPFHVNTGLRAWQADAGPRRAGVTALGVGGTNAHVILEEAPPVGPPGPSRSAELLVLSAKTEVALDRMARNLARHLRDHPELRLADIAHTLQSGRKAFEHRRAVVCRDREDAIRALESSHPQGDGAEFQQLHDGGPRRRVPLPTYPFERRRIPIEPDGRAPATGAVEKTSCFISQRTRSTAPHVEPRDDIERQLLASWREILGVPEVGVDDDFFALGGQSLLAVRFFDAIRERYGVDLPLSTLFEAPTITRCAQIVRTELETSGRSAGRSRWTSLVAMQPRGARPPFYCVAGMGGNLTNLRRLALAVGEDQPFYGLQPPGLDGRQARLYRVEDLGAHYVREILAARPEGPILLGGYSGGGVAAFEMACQLSRLGHEVAFLGFIDSFSPSLPRRSYAARARIHAQRAAEEGPAYLAELARRRLVFEHTRARRLVTRMLGKLSPETYRYDNIQDSWIIAERAYTPPVFPGAATLFRAAEESSVSLWTAFDVDEQHGWARFVRGGVDVLVCPGNHTTMCEAPQVEHLAAKLRASLDRALAARA